jgi:transcriptional regulator with XRE-family HTH domain
MSKKSYAYSRQTEHALALFGEHIRYARKLRSMTIAELAERLGISRTTVQNIEKGSAQVTIGSYFEAATLLGIELFQSHTLPLNIQQENIQAKNALLPAHIHKKQIKIKDDF